MDYSKLRPTQKTHIKQQKLAAGNYAQTRFHVDGLHAFLVKIDALNDFLGRAFI